MHRKQAAMTKILTHALALIAGTTLIANAHAQSVEDDAKLADLIEQMTGRNYGVLPSVPQADGSLYMDLHGKLQNVVVARLVGLEPVAACVGTLAEANAFLGRNLRTGAAIPSNELSAERIAARHGMSVAEFRHYSEMIEQAQTRELRSAVFTIQNNDGAGEGFNDATPTSAIAGNTGTTRGQQRLNLFNRAAQIWGQNLDSTISTVIAAQFDPLTPCSAAGGVLGQAGPTGASSNFSNAPFSNTFYPAALANKLRLSDAQAGAEISATFNSSVDTGCLGAGTGWYYGFDNATPANTINLLVVLLHEFGHGLGSLSFTDNVNGAFNGGQPDAWARLMFDSSLNRTWFQMTAAERVTSAVGGNLFWDGASVRLISPTYLSAGRDAQGRVKLFTPNPLQIGSSVSHFDTSASPNLLMEPAINTGIPLTLDLTRQQMRDIGWYLDANLNGVADAIGSVSVGGSSIAAGGSATVTWSNLNGFNQPVDVELSTDGGVSFSTILVNNLNTTGATGSFGFTAPNITTAQAVIRVRQSGFAIPTAQTINFSIANTAPTVTGATGLTRQQGTAASVSTIANISDIQSTSSALTVTTPTVPSGLVVNNLINTNGTVSANIAAACSATVGANTLVVRASDGVLSTDGNVNINVTLNSPPSLAYAAAATVLTAGGNTIISPTGPVDDNGTRTLTIASTGTFTGTVSVDTVGGVTITNAQPVGNHVITVRATDNCGAQTDASINLTIQVPNTAPSITASPAITRQQGSISSAAVNIASVTDAETPVGNLVVAVIAGGTSSGVTLSNITNTAGQITAVVDANCTAVAGTVRLQVSDGNITNAANLTINVSADTAPVLGNFLATSISPGGAINVLPSAPLSDNGTIAQYFAQANPTGFTGTLSTNTATGAVSIQNAGPAGQFTISAIARDNCNLSTLKDFVLTIANDADNVFRNGFE
jgi:hypothetical protein